ncbi:DUF7373 family lipoprotein [Nocardia australiensis]|uniref:DUF7373 family lipoprotein n=1 Tax=Nocardia australiensis TaxID=2887191 RepID=UPI001D142485|nr:hypothetical protein [Nocardia australiensis]
MVRMSRLGFTAAGVALVGVLAGCSVPGAPTAGEPDVRMLEVGTYQVDRHQYHQDAGTHGPLLEGMRMSDAVAPAVQIDPTLTYGRGSSLIATPDDAIDFLANVSKPVLENRKMVVGFASIGADRPDPAGQSRPSAEATSVTNVVLRFPDEATAKLAAKELEDTDMAVSPDNRKVASNKYPDSYNHWRPGIPTIGTFMSYKQFVISLFVKRPKADDADLLSWVDRTLAVEVPELDKFQATAQNQIDSLKVDPEGLLARVAVSDRSDHTPDGDRFAVYGANYLINAADDETVRRRLLQDTGADRVAIVDASSVTRVRDSVAAGRLIDGLISSVSATFDPITAPNDVPDSKCLQLNSSGNPDKDYKYRCYVPYKKYVGVVTSDTEPDVRQKVAAQYALLANSL